MRVEIWSDVVCPWCYIGKRRFEDALARFEHADEVQVEWKAFELDPSTRSASSHDDVRSDGYAVRLAGKYGTSVDQAQQMIDSMTAAASAEGLDFHFERAVRTNTFDAHQIIHLAAAYGRQDAVKERLMRAYFTEGEAVGDRDVLIRLATEAGMDGDAVRSAFLEQTQASAVRAEESEALALGISSVPFFVIDRAYGVSGAQSPDHLLAALETAWGRGHALTVVAPMADDACG